MKKLTIIHIELNEWNGFVFDFLAIETDKIDSSILGIYASHYFLVFTFLFIRIPVYEKAD